MCVEVPRGLTVRDEVGEIGIVREDCRKKNKPMINKLAYVCKQVPVYVGSDFLTNMPVLRYGRLKKIKGCECWWFRITDVLSTSSDSNLESIVRMGSAKFFDAVVSRSSKFVKKKFANEIDVAKKLLSKGAKTIEVSEEEVQREFDKMLGEEGWF